MCVAAAPGRLEAGDQVLVAGLVGAGAEQRRPRARPRSPARSRAARRWSGQHELADAPVPARRHAGRVGLGEPLVFMSRVTRAVRRDACRSGRRTCRSPSGTPGTSMHWGSAQSTRPSLVVVDARCCRSPCPSPAMQAAAARAVGVGAVDQPVVVVVDAVVADLDARRDAGAIAEAARVLAVDQAVAVVVDAVVADLRLGRTGRGPSVPPSRPAPPPSRPGPSLPPSPPPLPPCPRAEKRSDRPQPPLENPTNAIAKAAANLIFPQCTTGRGTVHAKSPCNIPTGAIQISLGPLASARREIGVKPGPCHPHPH